MNIIYYTLNCYPTPIKHELMLHLHFVFIKKYLRRMILLNVLRETFEQR